MTAPRDLTTIVEKVARDLCARSVPPIEWEAVESFAQYLARERILPIVVATIRAIDEGDIL